MLNKTVNRALIRYNTDSNGLDQCWRLVLDGEEVLVESVEINAPVFTSRDWIVGADKFKHHIAVGPCLVNINNDGIATINQIT